MTEEEILAMRPGSEMNKMVAEKIMEHKVVKDAILGYTERLVSADSSSIWSDLEPYSEDVSKARLLVEKMIEKGYEDAIYWADFGDGKYTEAEAICKAALLAVRRGPCLKEASDKILRQALGDDDKE
jgi:hypothetical protein